MIEPNQPRQSTADSSATIKQVSWGAGRVDSDQKREALREVLQEPLDGRKAIQSELFAIFRKAVLVVVLFIVCLGLAAVEVENVYLVVSFLVGAVAIVCWRSGPMEE